MSTITRERLIKIQQWRETYGLGSNVVLPAEEAEELARIALASLEAEPVAEVCEGFTLRYIGHGPAPKSGVRIGDRLYAAPPAPVSVPDERAAFNAWNNDTDCPLAGLTVKQAAWLAWLKRSGTIKSFGSPEQLEPVSQPYKLPSELLAAMEEVLRISDRDHDAWRKAKAGIVACRAAMLQGAEPVTTAYKLLEETGSSLQLRNLIRQRHAEWSQATFGDVGPIGPLKHLSKEALEAAAEPDDLSEWADMQFLLWDAQHRAGISDGEITAAMEEKLKVNMARQWPEPKDGEPRLHIKESGNSPVILDGWENCKHLLPIGELIHRLEEQTGEKWIYAKDAIPDGYVMVPIEPTEDMIVYGFESEPDEDFSDPAVWEEYQAMSGCQQAAHRAKLCWAAMIAAAPKPGDSNG